MNDKKSKKCEIKTKKKNEFKSNKTFAMKNIKEKNKYSYKMIVNKFKENCYPSWLTASLLFLI